MIKWYFYLHTNGDVIGKNPTCVESDPSYFDSPFVKAVWKITNIKDFTNFINEAREQGANKDKLDALIFGEGLKKEEVYKQEEKTNAIS